MSSPGSNMKAIYSIAIPKCCTQNPQSPNHLMSKNELNYAVVKSTPNLSGWEQPKFLCHSCYMLIRGGQGVPIQLKLEHGQSPSWRKESKASCQQVSGQAWKRQRAPFHTSFVQTRHMVPPNHHDRPRKWDPTFVWKRPSGTVCKYKSWLPYNTVRTQCLVIKTFLVLLGVGGGLGREVVYCYSFFFSMLCCLSSVWLCVVFIAF